MDTHVPDKLSTAAATLAHQTSRHACADTSPISPDGTASSALRRLRPTQNVTLQFPEDLDPANRHGLTLDERQCTFTPCQWVAAGGSGRLSILTRNGRITGLLGLPRPYQTLTAEVADVGGGFPTAVMGSLGENTICVAGGTGIAPFLTMRGEGGLRLLWSIRSDDFGAVEFALQEQLLRVDQWAAVTVFITSGEDAGGVVEKPPAWWLDRFALLRKRYQGLALEKRRMGQDDLIGDSVSGGRQILFCGSKSLEWQIRMSSMGLATVYCTEMV